MADTTLNFAIPKPVPGPTVTIADEFYRLQTAWDTVDAVLKDIQDLANSKASATHEQAIDTIIGLSTALAGKMPADTTFRLDDLTDVSGAAAAALGYILVKSSTGWVPSSAIAALGAHQHTISAIVGLEDALGSLDTDLDNVVTALAKRLRFDGAQTLTPAEKKQAAANLGAGGLSGLRNKILNPLGNINQRGKAGTVTLTAGQYGHDRFRAGAGGCTYTFAVANGVTTFTITAGTLQQVIEAAAFAGASGTYYLSWQGTAQARIGTGSYGTSGNVSATCNGSADVTVEWKVGTLSLPQFERDFVTAFAPRHIQEELMLCQRYYEEVLVRAVSYAASASYLQRTAAYYKVTKRVVPSSTVTVSSGSLTSPAVTPADNMAWIGFVAGGAGQEGTFLLKSDAEL